MFSTKNKTIKRTHDISGNLLTTSTSEQQKLLAFLEKDANSAYKRQWHRLERGLRLNRLRKFSEEESERLHLSLEEKTALYALLIKSLDKKILNSKTSVIYDHENERIAEIKGLVMHRNSSNQLLFQIVDKQKGVTFRRKKVSTDETQPPV